MLKPCDRCRLLFCDFVSRECIATPEEVAKLRPDLIKATIEPGPVVTPEPKPKRDRQVYLADYDEKRRPARKQEREQRIIELASMFPTGGYAKRRLERLRKKQCTTQ